MKHLGSQYIQNQNLILHQPRGLNIGFVIDSVKMTITLNNNKKKKLETLCANFLSGVTTIKTISQVLRKITSSFPAIKFGRFYIKEILTFLKQEH